MVAAPPTDDNLNAQSVNDDFLSSVTYQPVASTVRQCEKSTNSQNDNKLISASSAGVSHHKFQQPGARSSNHGSPNLKYPCTSCGMYGHWGRSQNSNGSFPPHMPSFDKPQHEKATHP